MCVDNMFMFIYSDRPSTQHATSFRRLKYIVDVRIQCLRIQSLIVITVNLMFISKCVLNSTLMYYLSAITIIVNLDVLYKNDYVLSYLF